MKMSEIEKQYDLIKKYWEMYLKKENVLLPKLYNKNNEYTKDALVLIKLSLNYPNTREISKKELTEFMKEYYPEINDVQQARHLGMQKGFAIASGTRGDFPDENISANHYKLISLEFPHPDFNSDRRKGFSGDFEKIKEKYNYRCATCGSKENKPHLINANTITELQQGHMNPTLPLVEGNIIPQCQICNRADRNRWVYDNKGRVIEIAQTEDGLRRVIDFINKANDTYKQQIMKLLQKSVKKS